MKKNVALFCSSEEGHFRLIRSLIYGLSQTELVIHVYTHRRFKGEVEATGAVFVDLFTPWPVEHVDNESLPVPCRFVSHAGHYAEVILDDVRKLKPSLIIYESFAVIGRVVAQLLDIPYINVSPGHNLDPARLLTQLQNDPRVAVSPACLAAVDKLRNQYSIKDASPFSYVSALSPYLNVCCQPSHYLSQQEKQVFEPVAFYGCLPSSEELLTRHVNEHSEYFRDIANTHTKIRIYVGFGTVVWRYFAEKACMIMKAASEFVMDAPDACAVMSLGGYQPDNPTLLSRKMVNTRIVDYVDQWSILNETDVFFTHHGLNSTHEAIFHRVPMVSCPFFGDQPVLADKCRQFGFALPLVASHQSTLTENCVHQAIDTYLVQKKSMLENLDMARTWEDEVIANRGSVHERVIALAMA